MDAVLLVIGLILLVKGADIFIDGSVAIAKRLNISELIIGLTIVASGTSAPELAVSLTASLEGANDIAISNVIGSNIFNILFVLGICALIKPINVDKGLLKRDIPYSLFATIVLLVMMADMVLWGRDSNSITRTDGIILLALFLVFLFYTIRGALKVKNEQPKLQSTEQAKKVTLPKSIALSLLGLVAIIFGGDLVVDNATDIAQAFGISETVIGLTIVAIGTSLPELVTSTLAAKRGNSDLAIGNVIGSNIFNIVAILGISSTITPIQVDVLALYDCLFLIASTVLLLLFAGTSKKISRVEGVLFVTMFIGFNIYILMR